MLGTVEEQHRHIADLGISRKISTMTRLFGILKQLLAYLDEHHHLTQGVRPAQQKRGGRDKRLLEAIYGAMLLVKSNSFRVQS
jgi:hypothetical protein